MKIILGPASKDLGLKIAERLRVPAVDVFFKVFPDGESYLRFEADSLQGEDVVIVQTTSPPQDQRLVQLFLMADNALDMNARSIILVVPYFAYSRQDKRFLAGEVYSVKTVVKLFEACGVSKIFTVNAHNPSVLKTLPVPVEDLSAIGLLADYFVSKGLVEKPFSLSLGKKALSVASEADKVLKGGFDFVSTKRDVHTGNVTLEDKELPVKGRDVIVFDDIISSGGTMAKAVKYAKEKGARKVYAACVHPLLTGDSYKKIMESGAEGIIGTDCVQSSVSKVSVAPLIAEALSRQGA
ncbi:MAG: ribose-phosphate diphosphokinase [Candidatus Bathyarchaeia archaeon]